MATETEVEALVATTIEWAGSLDIFVNNAGQIVAGDVFTASNTGSLEVLL